MLCQVGLRAGACGTWFWFDTTSSLIVIDMSQNVAGSLPNGGTPPMRSISSKMVYAALPDPKR